MVDVNSLNSKNDFIKRLGVSLNDVTYQKLDKLCSDYGLGRSAMISYVLNDFFMSKYQKDKKEA